MAGLSASAALQALAPLRAEYGADAAARKQALLEVLASRPLRSAGDVLHLHEILCFLRAWPDDQDVLALVERMLDGFDRRSDLRRHRAALAGTGIVGTTTEFRFFSETAMWLANRWGSHLTIDWSELERPERLEAWLPVLATWTESPGLDEYADDARTWIERLAGPEETDAGFLLRRFEQVRLDPVLRGALLDELDLPLVLAPAEDTPSRSREHLPGGPTAWQTGPLASARPKLPDALAKRPVRVRALDPAAGRRVLDLARAAMVVRSRDLDAFMYGDARDVRLVDVGDGLVIALIGMVPERRLLLETQYGYVVLKNGVPVGYGTITSLFGSGEIAYTIFDTFRSAQAAEIFARILRVAHHVFGLDAFMIDPYQIGQANEDAVQSGAWWFYRKLGFGPRDPDARRLMGQEERRMRRDRGHRSSPVTLRALAESPIYLFAGRVREDVLGVLPLPNVGLAATAYLAERFGYDRRRAERECAKEAAARLGVRSLVGVSRGERLAWERWGPVVLMLRGLERWPAADRRALAAVVRAKGGRRESDYLRRFDAHARLRRALQALVEAG